MKFSERLLSVMLGTCLCASNTGSTVRQEAGDAQFEFAARFEQPPRTGRPATLHLMVLDFTGYPSESTMVHAQVVLPTGWEVIQGRPLLDARMSEGELGWNVTVRPTRAGHFDLRRTLRIDRGRFGVDEADYVMPVYVGNDSSAVGTSMRVRLERVRDGRHIALQPSSVRMPAEVHGIAPELQFASDSLSPAAEDSARAGWVLEKLRPIEAKYPRNTFTPQIKFRALLASSAPVGELTAAADTLLFAELRGRQQPQGDFAGHVCLDVANALLRRHLSLPVAALYAQQAILCARGTETWLGGYSLRVLAQVQRALGQPDSAIATLRYAIASLNEYYNEPLIRDMQFDLGALLETRGANEEAIGAYFAAAAMGPNDSLIAVGPLRNLWSGRGGTAAELEARITEARRLWRDWRQGMSYGDLWKDRATGKWYSPAPEWELKDLAGKTVRSQELQGNPYALVFWGSWSQANRDVARLASTWAGRAAEVGVGVIGVNWELSGDSPASVRIAEDFMRRERLHFPVLMDSRQTVFKALNGRNYPQIFFIDREGLVHRTTIGYVPEWSDSLTASWKALRRE